MKKINKRSMYIVKYNKNKYLKIDIVLNSQKNKKIIEYLSKIENCSKSEYIKSLIRQDLEEFNNSSTKLENPFWKNYKEEYLEDFDIDIFTQDDNSDNINSPASKAEKIEDFDCDDEMEMELLNRYGTAISWNEKSKEEYEKIQKKKELLETPALKAISGYYEDVSEGISKSTQYWEQKQKEVANIKYDLKLFHNFIGESRGKAFYNKLEEMIENLDKTYWQPKEE